MDYYIVQKEEKNIDNDLANRLVDFLVINLKIPKIDAQMYIKHFPGIIKISGQEKTQNLSQDFRAAGLDNFIIEEKDFVPLPKRQAITGSIENLTEKPGLIAAGMIYKETEQKVTNWNPLEMKSIFALPLIVDSGVREKRSTSTQTTFYIDFITREKRWEISRSVFPEKEIKAMEQLDLLNTYLTSDIRKMFVGQKDIKTFAERKYYNEYLTWLMQLVYAKPYEA
ncbi:MAG: hypothetical protein JXA96_12795 [Sedimentisphaerales bacterium]|nr:hypothetical protein [Sedimentisphaerales bacterium]